MSYVNATSVWSIFISLRDSFLRKNFLDINVLFVQYNFRGCMYFQLIFTFLTSWEILRVVLQVLTKGKKKRIHIGNASTESTEWIHENWEVFKGLRWPSLLSLLSHIHHLSMKYFQRERLLVIRRVWVSDAWMWTDKWSDIVFQDFHTDLKQNQREQSGIHSKVSLFIYLFLISKEHDLWLKHAYE